MAVAERLVVWYKFVLTVCAIGPSEYNTTQRHGRTDADQLKQQGLAPS